MNERIIAIIAILTFAVISAILAYQAVFCLGRFDIAEMAVDAVFSYLFGYASINLYKALKRHNNGN